jgi:hypothetical protein
LVTLDIKGNMIRDEGAAELVGAEWPVLGVLVLECNYIGKEGLAALARL